MIQRFDFGSVSAAANVVRGCGMWVEPDPRTDLRIETPRETFTLPDGTVALRESCSLHESSRDVALRELYRLGYVPTEVHEQCCGLPFGHPDRDECQWFDLSVVGTTADGGVAYEMHERGLAGMTDRAQVEAWVYALAEVAEELGVRFGLLE